MIVLAPESSAPLGFPMVVFTTNMVLGEPLPVGFRSSNFGQVSTTLVSENHVSTLGAMFLSKYENLAEIAPLRFPNIRTVLQTSSGRPGDVRNHNLLVTNRKYTPTMNGRIEEGKPVIFVQMIKIHKRDTFLLHTVRNEERF